MELTVTLVRSVPLFPVVEVKQMTTTHTAPYAVLPASPLLGAEIVGVDLANGVDEATARELQEDFWRYKVLVFRNQHLTPDAHVDAVRIFDEPFDHPLWVRRNEHNRLVYVFDLEKAGSASTWHVGGTWRNPPFHIESLTYQVVPDIGGHTLWADLQAAYDGLSEPFKELVESVSAEYDAYPGDGTYDRPPVTETVKHPVVRTHRHTGRKGLFLSSSALRLNGIEPAEGKALLPFLLAHAASPNYAVDFGWKAGDFVIWDNQATWHFAVNDYDGPRAYRKVIGG
jgi:alpha-ketoglutarate-dependent taurine dioxygenase